ncbi:hypothetical protein [Paraburkholderia sp. MM6662-R1]|uniref:hypothetical protein n=1 Tax=Paraburkholderia sp. MM6662-R1 TaxID=2991066 RepID=UPI003D255CA9
MPQGSAFVCPHCGKTNDTHDNMRSDAKPKHGDASLCIGCGQLSVFDLLENCLRLPSDSESREFDQDPQIRMFSIAWRAVVRKTRH